MCILYYNNLPKLGHTNSVLLLQMELLQELSFCFPTCNAVRRTLFIID